MKLALGIVSAVFLGATPVTARAQTDWPALLERERKSVGAPGAAAAIVTGDATLWIGTSGLADVEADKPVTVETLFQVGSVTKNLTATLMMSLVDAGVVTLEDSVSRHLPEVGPVGSVTLRQLATHTSGLPRNPPNRVDVDGVMRAYSGSELLAALSQTTAGSHLGTEFVYSNFGYLLLGHALERAAGRPFEELLAERILRPLKMDSSYIQISSENEPRIAVHYWPSDDPLHPRPRWHFGEVAGSAGLTTTVGDLAHYLSFVIRAETGAGISAQSLISQRVAQIMSPDWRTSFGLGWSVWRDIDGSVIVWHEGELDGHSALIAFSPATEVGVVVLMNLGGTAAPDAGYRLFQQAIRDERATRTWTVGEARSLFESGQWGHAEAALTAAIELTPGDSELWRMLGVSRFELRDFAGAALAFERVSPGLERQESLIFMARVAAIQNEPAVALSLLQEARLTATDIAALEDIGEFRGLHSNPLWRGLVVPE